MPFLPALSLEGFRTFEQAADFKFAPLTILTGPNSSGKSSVLRALLLLKNSLQQTGTQTAWNRPISVLPQLKFDTVPALGSFSATHTQGHSSETFSIKISDVEDGFGSRIPAFVDRDPTLSEGGKLKHGFFWDDGFARRHAWQVDPTFRLTYGFRGLRSVELLDEREPGGVRIAAVYHTPGKPIEIKDEQGHMIGARALPDKNDYFLNGPWFRDNLGPDVESFSEVLGSNDRYQARELYNALDEKMEGGDVEGRSTAGVGMLYGKLPLGLIRKEDLPVLRRFLLYTVAPLFRYATEQLISVLNTLEFTPLEQEIRQAGQYTIGLEERARDFLELTKYTKHSPTRRSLQHWMHRFAIGETLEIDESTKYRRVIVKKPNGFDTRVTSLGFGHRRLLSFLLSLRPTGGIRRGNPMLLEEPETNLHPNLQSRLADLFVAIAKPSSPLPQDTEVVRNDGMGMVERRKKEVPLEEQEPFYTPTHQLVVETHSEYLIRRLQYLVATGVASPEDVAIYYLGPDPSADNYIKRITIAPSGKLSESFGPGFTDEATNLMIDLYKQTHQN